MIEVVVCRQACTNTKGEPPITRRIRFTFAMLVVDQADGLVAHTTQPTLGQDQCDHGQEGAGQSGPNRCGHGGGDTGNEASTLHRATHST